MHIRTPLGGLKLEDMYVASEGGDMFVASEGGGLINHYSKTDEV